jgi:hypothetical protein
MYAVRIDVSQLTVAAGLVLYCMSLGVYKLAHRNSYINNNVFVCICTSTYAVMYQSLYTCQYRLLLKLLGDLLPTTDYRHTVTTPAALLIGQYLRYVLWLYTKHITVMHYT